MRKDDFLYSLPIREQEEEKINNYQTCPKRLFG